MSDTIHNTQQIVAGEKPALAPQDRFFTGPPPANPFMSLRRYWDVLHRRRLVVVSIWLVSLVLAGLFSLWTKPIYQATARVEVGGDTAQLQSIQDIYQNTPGDETFLQTQVKILESANLARQTINQLKLQNSLPSTRVDLQGASTPDSAISDQLVQTFQSKISVQLFPDTRIIEISVDEQDPQLAAAIANSLVDNYSEYNFQKRLDSTKQASRWMEQQIGELKHRVELSQRALFDYEAKNSIVNLDDHQNTVEQRLADLTKALTDAQTDRMAKQSLSEVVHAKNVDSIAPTAVMEHLQDQYNEANEIYTAALNQYGPAFPKVKRLKSQLGSYQKLMDEERARLALQVDAEYRVADAKESQLAFAVALQKREVAKTNSLLVQENILKHDYQSNQLLFDNLVQHQKDAAISEGLRAANFHIVDRATAPEFPIRPRKLFNLGVGSAAGLVFGVSFALLLGELSNSITDAEELEQLLGVPAVGLIPRDTKKFSMKSSKASLSAPPQSDLALLNKPTSFEADSYRGLRASVIGLREYSRARVLVVTSPYPKEGKTRTAVNLAISLAQRGHNVLLVDADCRSQQIGTNVAAGLGLTEVESGLIQVLSDMRMLEKCIGQCHAVPNLSVLLSGLQTHNDIDLLSSFAMEDLLAIVRRQFDYVILDSSSLLAASDSPSLSAIVDGVIMVVESGVTTRDAMMSASKAISNAGGKLIGAVLNKVDMHGTVQYRKRQRFYLSS
jgi:succinoglycan biosynthesis transport protein ExoP